MGVLNFLYGKKKTGRRDTQTGAGAKSKRPNEAEAMPDEGEEDYMGYSRRSSSRGSEEDTEGRDAKQPGQTVAVGADSEEAARTYINSLEGALTAFLNNPDLTSGAEKNGERDQIREKASSLSVWMNAANTAREDTSSYLSKVIEETTELQELCAEYYNSHHPLSPIGMRRRKLIGGMFDLIKKTEDRVTGSDPKAAGKEKKSSKTKARQEEMSMGRPVDERRVGLLNGVTHTGTRKLMASVDRFNGLVEDNGVPEGLEHTADQVEKLDKLMTEMLSGNPTGNGEKLKNTEIRRIIEQCGSITQTFANWETTEGSGIEELREEYEELQIAAMGVQAYYTRILNERDAKNSGSGDMRDFYNMMGGY